MDIGVNFKIKTFLMVKRKRKRMDNQTQRNLSLLWKNSYSLKRKSLKTSFRAGISNIVTKKVKTFNWYWGLN